jgi:hypothetical protein
MLTYNHLFENTLRKLIQEEIDRLTENLALGLSVTDFASYREIVGQITGLKKVLELCDEAQSIVSRT